ncbi:hypothetical protein GGX14DRAFT_403822 [Mycena pura]|uniref:DUF6532 domain-containing protein n=1 Tax=Mycena pura TaxID=153505 RepID=A0AAD6UVU3_9AGAR|nr:hypothetical protein GGX14DRAFT_403822 [Mycena pura]
MRSNSQVWKVDQPTSWKADSESAQPAQEPASSRKRTSSTAAQASEVTKKARETGKYFLKSLEIPHSSDEDLELKATKSKKPLKSTSTRRAVAAGVQGEEDPQLKARSKKPLKSTSTARRYAAPSIDIDSESEATKSPGMYFRVDFTKVPAIGKSKIKAISVKSKTAKPSSVPVASKNALKVNTSTRKAKPVRLVADSASEDDSPASDDDVADDVDFSDESDVNETDDAAPDADEFVQEVPQFMAKHRDGGEEREDIDFGTESREVSPELDDDAPAAITASQLFESEEEEDDDEEMTGAPPRTRYTGDSDVDMHEAIADTLDFVPRGTHSRRSSTGSGWSSGKELVIPESEPNSDQASEPEMPAPHPPKKVKKVTAARQRKADLERPEVRPAAPAARAQRDSADDPANRPEASWHLSTRLALPAPNKDIGLTVQTPEVQYVMRGTTDIVRMNLYFITFFPLLSARVGWIRPQMILAASAQNSGYFLEYVLERLRTDPTFASILSPLPLDRVNLARGNIKRCAVTIVMVMYQLVGLTPAEVKVRVEELLKDHRYIFPVDPKTGQMQLSWPFHHPALKHVIKHEIMSSPLLKAQNYDRFPATHPKHPDAREVADPMVSIAATGVFASLSELRMTGERQPIAFTEESFEDIYLIHIKTLEDTRKNAPISTHKVLHQLFNDVTLCFCSFVFD